MWSAMTRFFTDEAYFWSAVGSVSFWLRWGITGLAGVIYSGVFPELTTSLGSWGIWISGLAMLIVIAKKNGDATPAAAKALAFADPALLAAHLKELGVPMGVANTAADKTAETAPSKV